MIGPDTSLIGLMRGRERRTSLGDIALNVLDHDDRVVDHNSMASTRPNKVSVVDREAEQNRARQTCRMTDTGTAISE